nr:hypothetical protein [Tanacetum cinerariifolium]
MENEDDPVNKQQIIDAQAFGERHLENGSKGCAREVGVLGQVVTLDNDKDMVGPSGGSICDTNTSIGSQTNNKFWIFFRLHTAKGLMDIQNVF